MVKGGLFSCIPLAVFMAALFLQFKSLFIKKKKDLVIQKKTTLLQIHTNEGLFYFSLFFFFLEAKDDKLHENKSLVSLYCCMYLETDQWARFSL